MKLLLCVLISSIATASATTAVESFQFSKFSAKVRKTNTTVYSFDLIYDPDAAAAHCRAVSEDTRVDCTGSLCVAYGSCGTPVKKNDSDPVMFSVSPDAEGTGLVVSVQSSYAEEADRCARCSKSGLKRLEDTVKQDRGVQVYTGPRSFRLDAVLTTYVD